MSLKSIETTGSIENMTAVQLGESRLSVLPNARDIKPAAPEALTGKADTADKARAELKKMFQNAAIAAAHKNVSLQEAITACKAGGISDKELQEWAVETGCWAIQTFRNVMSAMRKDNGEMVKIVSAYDKRLAKNRKSPEEKSIEDQCYDYLLSKYGSKSKAASGALRLNRRFGGEAKADAK